MSDGAPPRRHSGRIVKGLALEHVTAARPDFDMAFVRAATKMICPPVAKRYIEGLRKAGLAG